MYEILYNIVNIVMGVLTQAGFLICSVMLYVLLVGGILPRVLLKPKYDLPVIADRGLKKYKFSDGRAIVYTPSKSSAKYMKQYILSCHGSEKYIKCQLDERIRSIKFDVVAMNADDKVIDTIQVSEPVSHKGLTSAALLPGDTAYACVIVKEVNGRLVEADHILKLSVIKVAVYMLLTVLMTVAIGIYGNAMIVKWFDMALYDFVSSGAGGYVKQVFLCGFVGFVLSAIITLFHIQKDVKIRK